MAEGNGNGNGNKGKAGKPYGTSYKCSAERTKRIAALIAEGQTQGVACRRHGISESAFCEWMAKGGQPKGAPCYKEFRRQIEQARDVAEMSCVQVLRIAIRKGDWKAAAHWLRCRRPDDWSPEQKQRLLGDPEHPLVISVIKVPCFEETDIDAGGGNGA